jgi:hypothetical protein
MMYILCGAGRSCAIREGKASTYRGAILRREALELALYTFAYVKQTKSVVVFFPPKKGQKLAFALFFVRSEFDSELKQPLRRTLSAPVPIRTLPGELNSAERARIDDLTGRRVFRFEIDQSRSGGTILVLAPPVPGR